jgi:hypothetical protein
VCAYSRQEIKSLSRIIDWLELDRGKVIGIQQQGFIRHSKPDWRVQCYTKPVAKRATRFGLGVAVITMHPDILSTEWIPSTSYHRQQLQIHVPERHRMLLDDRARQSHRIPISHPVMATLGLVVIVDTHHST